MNRKGASGTRQLEPRTGCLLRGAHATGPQTQVPVNQEEQATDERLSVSDCDE